MKCLNCKSEVIEEDLMPSLLTDSLLCCPNCKGKSKHSAIIGTDPALTFNEAEYKLEQRKKQININNKGD